MSASASTSVAASPLAHPYLSGHSLTVAQRDQCLAELDRDGYTILPFTLPTDLVAANLAAIDRIAAEDRLADPSSASVKRQNVVDLDPAFRALMMYEPALQLAHDCFGPMFHLNQSNLVSRPNDGGTALDFKRGAGWHADGPRPRLFPSVNGAMGLHYLKFGHFLTDLTHGTGGSLQVVRGSHKRPELDGKAHGSAFHIEDYASDLVQFDCPAGTAVAFHQALWHAAPPNRSDIERKNLYISYCPTWMRPVDRDFPTDASLAALAPLSAEERWLLGEPRPALRWWLPAGTDSQRLARFARG